MLKLGAGLALTAAGPAFAGPAAEQWVDDRHTHSVGALVTLQRPTGRAQVSDCIREATRNGRAICAAGRRHSMGGQQLVDHATLLDTTSMRRVLACNPEAAWIEAEAGATWPDVIAYLQQHAPHLTIRQKQSIAGVTLGGSLSANAHGNGLGMAPLAADVRELELVDAQGNIRRCSRQIEPEWFRMAAGGYGLVGVITSLRLALRPRQKLRALADFVAASDAASALMQRAAEGAIYGSVALDARLEHGLLTYFLPDDAGHAERMAAPSDAAWLDGLRLLHRDRAQAWRSMCAATLELAGRTWWADDVLMSDGYVDDYHRLLGIPGCDPIAELMVPPEHLGSFITRLRPRVEPPLLASVRLVEADTDTVLCYAPRRMVSLALMFHTTPAGLASLNATLRAVLDDAIALGGTLHPAFGRFATRDQMRACLPWDDFVHRKRELDPAGRFRSIWYDAYT